MVKAKKQTALEKAQAALGDSHDDSEEPDVINPADLGDADMGDNYDEGDSHDDEAEGYLPDVPELDPWLLFDELIFREGLNLTVRHGPKWWGFKGTVNVGTSEGGPVMAVAEVVDTLYVPRFEDLKDDNLLLKFEHDPKCRNFYGLIKVMKECYPGDHVSNVLGFTREGPVTLVFFVLRVISDGVAFDTQAVTPDLQEVAEVAPEERTQSRTMEGRMMLASDVR